MKDLIEHFFTLINLQHPIISLESPLQERQKLLFQIAVECELQNIKCYLWSLEDDQLYQLKISLEKITFSNVNEYQPIKDKSRQEHYFEILRFWKFTDLQG